MGKVQQLKRWVVFLVGRKAVWAKRGRGKGRLQFCGGRIVGWSSMAWEQDLRWVDVGGGGGPGC